MADVAEDLAPLIALTSQGDRQAFARLYAASKAKLFATVLRIVKDRGRAEEVLQEAYLRIWRHAARFDAAAGRPITWMAAIAHNAAIDEVRRGAGARTVSLDEEESPYAELPDPTLRADTVELEALRRCLDRLDPEQRRCVLLAYHEGYSREELSEKFDRPVGTIKSWLHRALGALQTCLGIA